MMKSTDRPSRLQYTFEAGVRALLARPGDIAREIGKSYSGFYRMRRGSQRLTVPVARALVANMRRRASRLDNVADALERAADIEENKRD